VCEFGVNKIFHNRNMITVYISTRCTNSMRLFNIVKRTPSLQGAQVVDIDHGVPAGIESVPTIVDDRGTKHVGSSAFEFLKKFEAETDLQPMDLGSGGGLAFGSLDGGGELDFVGFGAAL